MCHIKSFKLIYKILLSGYSKIYITLLQRILRIIQYGLADKHSYKTRPRFKAGSHKY
jgi:hypothetical protein